MGKYLKILGVCSLLVFVCLVGRSFSEEADTLYDAVKGGKVSGTLGSYYEFIDKDAIDSNSSWQNIYATVKYETLTFKRAKIGARFFVHQEYNSTHDDGVTIPYEGDVEDDLTLPELYLNVGLLENSSVTVGRWANVGHIADGQSEGAYLTFKEIEKLEVIAGVMSRFADIDYDDGEDFGRANDSQNVDDESTYGSGSAPVMLFLETKYQPIELLELNPFFMYHDDYASVTGIDANIAAELEDLGLKYGGTIKYVHVDADIAGSTDADIFAVQPFAEKGPVKLELSYSTFDNGTALLAPGWLDDPYCLSDQDKGNSVAGSDFYEALLTYSIIDDLWVSYAFGTASWDLNSDGDGYEGNEFQVGYQITKNLDVNVRYFIVKFENVDNKDYNKVEARVRFKF